MDKVSHTPEPAEEQQQQEYEIKGWDEQNQGTFANAFEVVRKDKTRLPAAVRYLNGVISNLSDQQLINETREWFRGMPRDIEDERLPTKLTLSRNECAADLREKAKDFLADQDADELMKQVALRYGRFLQTKEQLEDDSSIVRVWRSLRSGADHISFRLEQTSLSAPQAQFLLDVEGAMKVIFVVYEDIPRVHTTTSTPPDARVDQREQKTSRRNYYIRKLADIARTGLRNTNYGSRALASFTNEFLAREATFVKNRYVRRLGWRCLIFASCFLAVFLFMTIYGTQFSVSDTTTKIENYALLALGATCGCWLSFSIRRVNLGFEDLALLEDDRLEPHYRIIFVVLLTSIIGMLSQVGIGLTIADKKIVDSPIIALLAGMLSGIGERALSGIVTRGSSSLLGGHRET
jgi:hypothetical protein